MSFERVDLARLSFGQKFFMTWAGEPIRLPGYIQAVPPSVNKKSHWLALKDFGLRGNWRPPGRRDSLQKICFSNRQFDCYGAFPLIHIR